jgi:aspartate carbamoyltransferase regulatory subunit
MFRKFMCKAPYYAKDPKYISEKVLEPTDYIVLDHSVLEHDLAKYGIDSNMFWNIWRLTPSVFRYSDGRWAIKAEFDILNSENLNEVAPYIYASTVEIILAIQTYQKNTINRSNVYCEIGLVGKNIPVFEKADSQSRVTMVLPDEIKKVACSYCVEGLANDRKYWSITGRHNEKHILGFVMDENVENFETVE